MGFSRRTIDVPNRSSGLCTTCRKHPTTFSGPVTGPLWGLIRIRIHLFQVKTHIQLVHTLKHLNSLLKIQYVKKLLDKKK